MFEPLPVAGGSLQLVLRRGEPRLRGAPVAECPLRDSRVDPAIGVEQRAVAAGVEETAVVMLPVNFDKRRTQLTQQRDGGGLIVDERPAAAVGLDDTPDDERFAGLGGEPVLVEDAARRMTGGQLEAYRHHRLRLAGAD